MVVNNGDKTEYINLKVIGLDNVCIKFKVNKHKPLKKLMRAFCQRRRLPVREMRFLYDGQHLSKRDTPSSFDMEEGDTIDVFPPQYGGFSMCRNRN